ncbi:sugar phosphate isomerase/epimerase [Paracoccus sp. M683]|uniref:sugar phosphate isomerase/epimerase family protein n=1 Tax=Paracoccus sp. M683 TaxID=2594268 RepID=UPI00117C6387|nr:sugar phosphate isomerase/epimerase [Paracoccus sp. M683]TRW99139.1 sugar phosphate isomerase/epimerase [Paracoccus sp. M683]
MTFSTLPLRGLLAGASLLAVLTTTAPAFAQDRNTGELPIAVQMFTLRDYGTLDEQLAAVQAAGITAVETVGMQNTDAETLKSALDAHGITAISTHAQLADLRDNLDAVLTFNKAIGNSVIVVPYLQEEERPQDAAGWVALGEELAGLNEQIKAQGMVLAYHNHDFEMAQFDGRTALEIMLEAAGPDVMAQLDLAWVARGGLDPAEYLGRFDDRVFAVHAKDNAPQGEAEDERGFKALGQGTLDWATILPAADAAGADWYIVEHDQPLDAAAVVKTGGDFLTANLPADVTRP